MIKIQISPIKEEVYVCYCVLCTFKTYAHKEVDATNEVYRHYTRVHNVNMGLLTEAPVSAEKED